jgi:hypothetical protein
MVSLFHGLFDRNKSGPLEAGDGALLPRALINMLIKGHLKIENDQDLVSRISIISPSGMQ